MRNSNWRFLLMIGMGIGLTFLIKELIGFPDSDHPFIYDLLLTVFITVTIWEGCLRIDSWLNVKHPWTESVSKRIGIQFLITLFFSSTFIYVPMLLFNLFICTVPLEKETALFVWCLIIGISVSFIILLIEISAHFFVNWKASLLEVEKYKTESTQAQLKNLKDHVNPHFLFNNLSVLSSLVYKDQDKAVDFINELSKVYRYVLESQENELVSVETELAFIESYRYLLNIRFGDSLKFNLAIDPESKLKCIPPMSLQLLVENCIKHNEVSEENPLEIRVETTEDSLTVSNNLQERKDTEEKSNTGLKNIIHRFAFYTNKEVIVTKTEDCFTVKIPLLKVN